MGDAGGGADYDLLILGGGAAGITAGKVAGSLGFRVAIVEAGRLGGECTWTGCVPSKALLAAARAMHVATTAERFGLPRFTADGPVDLAGVLASVHERQHEVYESDDSLEALARYGCGVVTGRARFVSPEAVEVDGRRLVARRYLVATGSAPAIPPVPGLADAGPLTNETLFQLDRLPGRLAVIGGGATGLEMAQAFRRLGSEVTVYERERLLPGFSLEAAEVVRDALEAEGVRFHVGVEVDAVRGSGETVVEAAGERWECDRVLVAAGRTPRTADLGLDRAGVDLDERGFIAVDPSMRTSNARVYAAGDVVGGAMSTTAGAAEAVAAVRSALYPGGSTVNHERTVFAVYTDPEVARIGLSAEEARDRHRRVHVYRYPFARNDRARLERATEGFVTLVCAGWRDRVVGAEVVGLHAADLVNEVAVGMSRGIRAPALAGVIHGYPTRGEAVREAAQGALERWGRAPWARAALRVPVALLRLRS